MTIDDTYIYMTLSATVPCTMWCEVMLLAPQGLQAALAVYRAPPPGNRETPGPHVTIFRCVLQGRFLNDVLNEITVFGRLLGVQEVTFSPSICGRRRGRAGRAGKERGGEGERGKKGRRGGRGRVEFGGEARWRVSPEGHLDIYIYIYISAYPMKWGLKGV